MVSEVILVLALGIDPGTAITGYGLVNNEGNRLKAIKYGSIFTEAKLPLYDRLNIIFDQLTDIIEEYRPEVASIESLFFNNNAKTALSVGHARGVALLACVRGGIEIVEYTPLQVKLAVSGYGRADKKQMIAIIVCFMVLSLKMLLCLEEAPKPDDTADALAIAICHLNSYKLTNKMKYGGV